MSRLKDFLCQNFELVFICLFFIVTLSLVWVPWRWDEWIYLNLNFIPLIPHAHWVPHPPLLWYLLATFSLMPRMAILICSSACMLFLFYACKRLYEARIARLAVAVLATNWLYMLLGSLVMFTDGPVTVFMTISLISFLCWLKLDERKFLLISGFGLALASLTKYTAAPIILITAFVWLIALGKRLGRARILEMFSMAAVSLLPLGYWIYLMYQMYGNFVSYYSTLYDLFPSSSFLTFFSSLFFVSTNFRFYPSMFALNIGFYAVSIVIIANLSLIPIVRQRQFDLDSKLLLVYLAVIFFLFVIIQKQDIGNFRYLLPMIPAIAVISAKNMVKEKWWLRFLIIFFQFLGASVITYVALVLYPFR